MESQKNQYDLGYLRRTFDSFEVCKDGRSPRAGQLEAVQFALNSDAPVSVIHAGMGSGKSLVSMVLSRVARDAIVLVHSKALQNQYTDEFPEAVSLFGRSNYPCIYDVNTDASDCAFNEPWDKEKGCPVYMACPYKLEKARCAAASMRVLNYAYFMAECNFVTNSTFSGKPMVVCDEADSLDQVLMGFIRVEVTEKQIRDYGLAQPRYKTVQAKQGLESWLEWADKSSKIVKKVIDGLPDDCEKKEKDRHVSLYNKLNMFQAVVDDTWLYDEQKNRYGRKWVFSPTWVKPELTDKFLRRHASKLVLMSATFKPLAVTALELGIPKEEIDYFEVPPVFDPRRKPIYMSAVAELSNKTTEAEWPKAERKIREILARHKGQKGLIHTASYKLANLVMGIGDPRLVTHKAQDRLKVLEDFKTSSKPLVLVSPSMERGISLNDDMARFCIILKAPFPSLGDKQVSTRLYGSGSLGQYWYRATTAQTIEQQTGRAVRSENDWCHVYLLDTHIQKLISRDPTMFSKSFRDGLTWSEPDSGDCPVETP